MDFSRFLSLVFLLFLCSCEHKNAKLSEELKTKTRDFIISFASCNNQNTPNLMWDPILSNEPQVFIWGGDIIYSDTYDMSIMSDAYQKMKNDSAYMNFKENLSVLGIWDDHDYGINDGGANYSQKDSVQQIFLDFFDVDSLDIRRKQKGVYNSKLFKIGDYSINIILLDTRYFRSELSKDPEGKKRYIPDNNSESTMLGTEQWNWLENELTSSKANFNIIMSSIQFLSYEHGFESWGNMPNEVIKMNEILAGSKAKGIILLSGDRHIAEISKANVPGMTYPLIDFTSSGMTHSYDSFKGESNPYRVSEVVSKKNFGILRIDLTNNLVKMEIRGENNVLFQSYIQKY